MSHWGNVLREARTRAKLTQEQLAEKVPISVSYIRKMETGLIGPPRRDKAEDLADTLNITDPEERNAFFRAAEVGNDEDMEGFRLVKVENDEAVKSKQQASSQPPPGIVRSAKPIPDALFGTSREEFYDLIASACLTDEDEENIFAAFGEIAKPILALYEKGKER